MSLDDIVQKGQPPPLSSERTLANSGEMRIAVERQSVEYGHHTYVLHASILDDSIEDNLPMCIDILQLMPRNST